MGEEKALSEVCSRRRKSFLRTLARASFLVAGFLAALFATPAATAQSPSGLQFDVFVGLDQYARQGAWFPLVCEVKNEGPGFSGVIEVSSGNQKRRMPIELPTGTLKRVTIPLFSTANSSQFRIVLRDARGNVRAEHQNQYARNGFLQSDVPLMAAIPRSAAGMPNFIQGRLADPSLKVSAARLTPELFPDNPITLQSATAIYLNSERAIGLRPQQVDALLGWLDGGGHLILGLDQIAQVSATPWLRDLVNADLLSVRNVSGGPAISAWTGELTNRWAALERRTGSSSQGFNPNAKQPQSFRQAIVPDANFLASTMAAIEARPRDGTVVLEAEGAPLMYQRAHGRGRVTVLTFDPERQPFLGYNSRAGFWTRLVDAPDFLYAGDNSARYGRQSFDAAIGALIETTQVRKLSLGWLLLMLIAYAAIIGPFDYVLVRRLKRPMLTWITFPSYVVLFSVTIYVIGYKLRAGRLEWNELSIIDVLEGGKQPVWRGKTYGSLYSPQNARYPLAVTNALASLRGEARGYYGNTGGGDETYSLVQMGNGFAGEINVPIWVSQLCVADWMRPGTPSFSLEVQTIPGGHKVRVKNLLGHSAGPALVAKGTRLVRVDLLKAGEVRELEIKEVSTTGFLPNELAGIGAQFAQAISARSSSFDSGHQGTRPTVQTALPALAFIDELNQDKSGGNQGYPANQGFSTPAGLNLSPLLRDGYAVLVVLDEGPRSAPGVPSFTPDQGKIQTVWRMAAKVAPAK